MIKACPFCKNKEEGKLLITDYSDDLTSSTIYWVECGGCEACGPACYSEEKAIEYWNKAKR